MIIFLKKLETKIFSIIKTLRLMKSQRKMWKDLKGLE